ncbi:MAG TPA: CHAD domain-containing protein [Terracidiphilus sp.]|jgi:CHAD domain-containing protein
MNVDVEKAIKPLRKLRNTLNDFPADPSPDEVHNLRTRTRRLEAIVHALPPDSDRCAPRLLKHAKPVRRAAGKVRDMDVLLAKLFALSDDDGDGLLRLADHLASRRRKYADRLSRVVDRRRKKLRRLLKQYADAVEENGSGGDLAALSTSQRLTSELEHWPRLHQDNLHDFRIRAKELRYMLQLSPEADRHRMEALDEIKDAAGEWHDWVELRAIATEVLNPKADAEILSRIDLLTQEKLRASLAAANRLRTRAIEGRAAA